MQILRYATTRPFEDRWFSGVVPSLRSDGIFLAGNLAAGEVAWKGRSRSPTPFECASPSYMGQT